LVAAEAAYWGRKRNFCFLLENCLSLLSAKGLLKAEKTKN
jgi:hypothetical protein